MHSFEEQNKFYIDATELALKKYCEMFFTSESEVAKAAKYSLLNGGKRVRAVLALSVCEMLSGSYEAALPFACAVEMVHCYSLIHDDLPCMDNDDMRRGKPSCHKAFDEATALLAGDALLTAAFETVCENNLNAQKAVKILSELAGVKGMIYGQELDLKYENCLIDAERLCEIHKNKTGRLINAAAKLGAVAACADESTIQKISEYAYSIGLTFQIIDDILDVTSNEKELGKPIGSDSENNKCTFVSLYGIEGSMKEANELTKKACGAVGSFDNSEFLVTFAKALLNRKK